MGPGPDLQSGSTNVGLHVIFGSRTRRGLSHPNEDRHAVATWADWDAEAHLPPSEERLNEKVRQKGGNKEGPGSELYPMATGVLIPSCVGSARKDTTVSGYGATGGARSPFGDFFASGSGSLRPYQESNSNAFMWTVCDGHDGPEAADFVCRNISDTFSRLWHLNLWKEREAPRGGSGSASNTPPENSPGLAASTEEALPVVNNVRALDKGFALSNALARTFESLDVSFREQVWPDYKSVEAPQRPPRSTAGSCVTSVFLVGNLMCCAGLGDCKAAILTLENADILPQQSSGMQNSNGGSTAETHSTAQTTPTESNGQKKVDGDDKTQSTGSQQQFQITWFSKDHRSTCPKERARIRARGGWFKLHRVGGVLEPTRTIGDFDVKASQPPGVLIATPEVRTYQVTKPALVLVASDGVWDVMDASQLLRSLKKRRRLWRGVLSWLGAKVPEKRSLLNFGFRRRARSKEGFENLLHLPTTGDLVAMAETLVTRAHDLGSDDDCTCLCLYLRPSGDGVLGGPLVSRRSVDRAESSSRRSPEEESEGAAAAAKKDVEEEVDLLDDEELLDEEDELEDELCEIEEGGTKIEDDGVPRRDSNRSMGAEKWKPEYAKSQVQESEDEQDGGHNKTDDEPADTNSFPLNFRYKQV